MKGESDHRATAPATAARAPPYRSGHARRVERTAADSFSRSRPMNVSSAYQESGGYRAGKSRVPKFCSLSNSNLAGTFVHRNDTDVPGKDKSASSGALSVNRRVYDNWLRKLLRLDGLDVLVEIGDALLHLGLVS